MADFNSSDLDLGPDEPDPFAHFGAKSIEAMFESRYEDRAKTKKRMAQLKDTSGTPGSVRDRARWMNRFETYMTQARGLSAQQVPTGDDVARFAESISSKLIPRTTLAQRDKKLVVSLKTLRNGIEDLMHGLKFKFSDFHPSEQETRRIDTVLDSLVKEGTLIKGTWRKREYVGFYILRIMGQAWFARSLKEGCLSWDTVISRYLPISLMAATAGRAGDITRSAGYSGLEYLRWEHIELVLESGPVDPTPTPVEPTVPTVQDMVAKITIAYEKGKKDVLNRNKVITVKALDDAQDNTVCPIKLLLTHALRTGHVGHTSIGSLLAFVQSCPGRTVQWTNEHDPVVPAIENGRKSFLDFSKPASTQQVLSTVKIAGLLAAILEPLHAHDIRAGAARDLVKLPVGSIKGAATPTVAKMLGHSHKAMASGITDDYVGPLDTTVNAVVAKHAQAPDRHGPKVGQGAFVKRVRIPAAEVADFCKENGLDYSVILQRKKAYRLIHAREEERWYEEQKAILARPSPVVATATATATAATPAPADDVAPLARKRPQSATASTTENNNNNSKNPLAEMSPNVHRTKRQKTKPTNNNHEKGEGTPSGAIQNAVPDALIDPTLLPMSPDSPAYGDPEAPDELLESTPVDAAIVSGLESMIIASAAGSGGGDDDDNGDADEEGLGSAQLQKFRDRVDEHIVSSALEEVIAESSGRNGPPHNDPTSVLRLPGTEFVDFFSKINVVRNGSMVKNKALVDQVPNKFVATGNSRDKPSMFLIPCPNAALGCDYRHANAYRVQGHAVSCNHKLQQQPAEAVFENVPRPFACGRAGCTSAFRSQSDLNQHIIEVHDFIPRKCFLPDCPTPDVVFSTQSAYKVHTRDKHDPDWTPSGCGVPGCTSSTLFSTRFSYKRHLHSSHKLRGEEKDKYLPPREKKASAPKRCPVKDCKSETLYKMKSGLKSHLALSHNLKNGDEMQSLLDGW